MKGLIASDIDGTLLVKDGPSLPREVLDEIVRLLGEGWAFSAASGRQYNSLRRLFAPIADQISYICSNGAVVFDGAGKVLDKTVLPRAQALELAHEILALPECEVLISGEDMNYLLPKQDYVVRLLRDVKGNNVAFLSRPEDAPEDIVKVSAYLRGGVSAFPAALMEKWARFHPAVADPWWVDFTLADKGLGLVRLCGALGVELKDTVAFGDSCNDVPLLSRAGRPYLMDTAGPGLLSRFPHHCHRVLDVLRQL